MNTFGYMKIPLLLLGVTGLAALAGCGRHANSTVAESQPAVAVRTASAEKIQVVNRQAVAGTVRPQARALVAAKIMGTVARADFAVGQAVADGEPLVSLTAAEIGARVEQAQAGLAQARRDYEREAALLAKGAATAESVHALEDRRRIAEAALVEATTMQGYTEITAPFAGIITKKFVYAGDFAAPGTPLFEIEGADRLRAEVQVPESLPLLAPGASLDVQTEDGSVGGVLAELSPAADPSSRTRLAKVDLPAGSAFRSGQFVRVLWPAGESGQITVPAGAVSMFGQMERVFTVSEGRAHLRLVKTGARDGGRVEILAGLDAGEIVVVDALPNLRDGQPVEVTR